jgi:predicted FMN-binding regulatory protein PaiB
VVSAEEVVAHVPSWMVDPERACPATTLFRSVQVHGTLTEVEDLGAKARALESLMRRWQPEGLHRPIDAEDPRYRRELEGVLVFAVPFERVDGRWKLLQGQPPEQIGRILRGLRERGAPGDAEAIEAIREANPGVPDPPHPAPAPDRAAMPRDGGRPDDWT